MQNWKAPRLCTDNVCPLCQPCQVSDEMDWNVKPELPLPATASPQPLQLPQKCGGGGEPSMELYIYDLELKIYMKNLLRLQTIYFFIVDEGFNFIALLNYSITKKSLNGNCFVGIHILIMISTKYNALADAMARLRLHLSCRRHGRPLQTSLLTITPSLWLPSSRIIVSLKFCLLAFFADLRVVLQVVRGCRGEKLERMAKR